MKFIQTLHCLGIVTILCNTVLCDILNSESFSSCGLSIQSYNSYKNTYQDILHQVIVTIQKSTSKFHPSIITNENGFINKNSTFHIFRGMRYNCFLHLLINLDKDIFETLPSARDDDIQTMAVYLKAIFIVFVDNSPHELYDSKDWKNEMYKQHRLFVYRIKYTRTRNYLTRPFKWFQTYFFCSFCKPGMVVVHNKNDVLALKNENFQRLWKYAHHYWYLNNYELTTEAKEYCETLSVMELYRLKTPCLGKQLTFQLITEAARFNFSLDLIHSPTSSEYKFPAIVLYETAYTIYKYYSVVLEEYNKMSVLYCLYQNKLLVPQRDMWNKNVSLEIWHLVLFTLLVLAVLETQRKTLEKLNEKWILVLFLLVRNFAGLLRAVFRQSFNEKWILLSIVELLFSILLTTYENCITVNVVVPLVAKPWQSTRDLIYNNYTFVIRREDEQAEAWLLDEYNTKNNRRSIVDLHFKFSYKWIKKYLIYPANNTKYAIVESTINDRNYLFVKDLKINCNKMYPPEIAFSPIPTFFGFSSPVAASLIRGILLVQSTGHLKLIDQAQDFARNLKVRQQIKHGKSKDKKNKNFRTEEFERSKIKENLITMENCGFILHCATVAVGFATGTLFFEYLSSRIYWK